MTLIFTCRLHNSRIFCENERPSIFERMVWSECKNGEGEWAYKACALGTRGSRLQRFAPFENVRKRLFCSLLYMLILSPCTHFIREITVGGSVASWSVHSFPGCVVQVKALTKIIALCFWARHIPLTMPLSTSCLKCA